MVARLAAGDATVGELAAALRRVPPGGVQAHQGARRRRPGEPAQGRPAPAVPPRGGGPRPDDDVDRALPPAGPGALRAPRRRPRRDAGRRTTRSPPTPTARSSVMSPTTNRHQVSIEADPTVPIIRITRDFDATPAQLMRAHTDPELFARWVGPTGWRPSSSTGTPPPAAAGATSPASTARSTASTAASTRSARTASCRPSPSTASPRGSLSRRCGSRTSATAAPGCTPSRSSTASRVATSGWPAAWRPGVEEGYAKLDALAAEL
jgi:hypothetical protein